MDRKPFIVEFTGIPEAGKTSTISKISELLTNKGFKVVSLEEAAKIGVNYISSNSADWPTWIILNTAQRIIEQVNKDSDIILVDRGIIDRTYWNLSSFRRQKIDLRTKQERDFLLSSGLFPKSDMLIIFEVDPSESIRRRGGEGSWTTVKNVTQYNEILKEFKVDLNDLIPSDRVHEINTTNVDPESITDALLFKIIEHYQKYCK